MPEIAVAEGLEYRSEERGAIGVDGDGAGVRPPKQERSRKTLDRILAAALELFRDSGVDGTTVSGIVDRAETSVGSFYARFSGKDELVRFLRNRYRSDVLARWDQGVEGVGWSELPLGDRVREAVALLVRAYVEDWTLGRVLDGGLDRPGEAGSWWSGDFRRHALEALVRALLVPGEEIPHPDPERALEIGFRMVAGAIRDAVEVGGDSEWEEGAEILDGLTAELARAWTAYLEVGPEGIGLESGDRQGRVGEEVRGAGGEEEDSTEGEAPEADFFDPWG
jgi:AcrR family transcriptional regulator